MIDPTYFIKYNKVMEELKFCTYQDTLCNYKVFIVNVLYGKPHYTYYKWAIDKYKIPYNLNWSTYNRILDDDYILKMQSNRMMEYDDEDYIDQIDIQDVRRKCEIKFPL